MGAHIGGGRVALLISDGWNKQRVASALQRAQVSVETPNSMLSLLALLACQPVDLVVLEDRRNDILDGVAALKFQGLSSIPVIAIGPGSIQHIADALGHGAADYLSQAESEEAMTHRILARLMLLHRPPERTALRVGDMELDPECRALRCAGTSLSFTSREFELAWALFEQAGEVVRLQILSRRVWGRDASIAKRTIEQHISRVRQKLSRAGALVGSTVQVQAIHNIGYRLTHAPMRTLRVAALNDENDFSVAA